MYYNCIEIIKAVVNYYDGFLQIFIPGGLLKLIQATHG